MPQDRSPATSTTVRVEVVKRRFVATDVVELTLRSMVDKLPEWDPGAHIDVRVPGDRVRQYSLCGDPTEREVYRIAVLREAQGQGGSVHLHDNVPEGSALDISSPRNHFQLVHAERYVFIAGGIGITPLLPMVRAVTARGAQWTLHYCGRTASSMAYTQDLVPNPRVRITCSDNGERIDIERVLGSPEPGTAIYCCGPERLLDAVEDAARPWPADAVHAERFKPKDIDLPANPFEVELRRTGTELRIPAERALIDVLEGAGIVVPASCRVGTCGTCETMVLEGTPEHRDSVLTPTEQDAGDCMMVCVSRSRSSRLVLDL
ncbi:oxidoreductase [Rhodococcus fascians]|nr:oxidoreductase [Rhodococcus fascians]MBY4114624.1 oxidoreductase [Rhodococcus fascians]